MKIIFLSLLAFALISCDYKKNKEEEIVSSLPPGPAGLTSLSITDKDGATYNLTIDNPNLTFTFTNLPFRVLSMSTASIATTFYIISDGFSITLPETITATSTAIVIDTATHATYTYNFDFAGYDASTNPYGVYVPIDLAYINGSLASSYKMLNNIGLPPANGVQRCAPALQAIVEDYCSSGLMPIGNASSAFTGIFDGNGKIIQNLEINRPNIPDYVGLFGIISNGAMVKNVGLEKALIYGDNLVGALVGYSRLESTITGSYASGTLYAKTNAGGLVGGNKRATIANSYSKVNVSGDANIGGFLGINESGTITSNYSSGNVYISEGMGKVGGFVGISLYNDPIDPSNYRNANANISGTITNTLATPIPQGGTMTGGTWSDASIWKSAVAFPALAWQ